MLLMEHQKSADFPHSWLSVTTTLSMLRANCIMYQWVVERKEKGERIMFLVKKDMIIENIAENIGHIVSVCSMWLRLQLKVR